MPFARVLIRSLASAMVLPAALVACSPATTHSAQTSPAVSASAASSVAPLANPVPAAPAPAACDVQSMPLRDKLAQLLMVGVQNAADARAVVTDNHVGGIFIGSWTDLSMLTDGSIPDIAGAAGPLALAVSVDEEGGRVQRLSSLIGSQPVTPGAGPDQDGRRGVPDRAAARPGHAGRWASRWTSRPSSTSRAAPDDTVIGDRSFGSDPAVVTEYAGAYARGLRDAGLLPVLKHFPGHGHGVRRLAHRRGGDPAAGGSAEQRPDAVPHAGRRAARRA